MKGCTETTSLAAPFISENVQKVDDGFYCFPCRKVIKYLPNVYRHVKEVHLEKNICYKCPTCKNISKSSSSFKVHITNKHPDLKGVDISQFAYYTEVKKTLLKCP